MIITKVCIYNRFEYAMELDPIFNNREEPKIQLRKKEIKQNKTNRKKVKLQ